MTRITMDIPDDVFRTRLDLAVALLESLEDGPTEDGPGAAWSAEARRRLEEVCSGAVKPDAWEEAEGQIFDLPDGRKGHRGGPKA